MRHHGWSHLPEAARIRAMVLPPIKAAAEAVAQQVMNSLAGLRRKSGKKATIYAYALVPLDDFSSVMAYANTDAHLAKKNAGDTLIPEEKSLNKWYFGQWWSGGMDHETGPLAEALGDASSDDVTIQAAWLLAMAEGLKLARERGALEHSGNPVVAFCSMADSSNAAWIEPETARHSNPPNVLDPIRGEMRDAVIAWYGKKSGNRSL